VIGMTSKGSSVNDFYSIRQGGCVQDVGRSASCRSRPPRPDRAINGYVARYHGEDDAPSFGREIVVGPGERRKAEVSLPLAGELSGHVREADGRPMARGYVFFDNLSFANRSFHAVTDAEGYYWVSDLPPGDYRVSARRYSPSARQVVGERWRRGRGCDRAAARGRAGAARAAPSRGAARRAHRGTLCVSRASRRSLPDRALRRLRRRNRAPSGRSARAAHVDSTF